MRVTYTGEVRAEVADAIRFYRDSGPPRLWQALIFDMRRTMEGIAERPLRWRKASGEFRRAPLSRFPYCIIYLVDEDGIWVTAFMPLHQLPGYWKGGGRI